MNAVFFKHLFGSNYLFLSVLSEKGQLFLSVLSEKGQLFLSVLSEKIEFSCLSQRKCLLLHQLNDYIRENYVYRAVN